MTVSATGATPGGASLPRAGSRSGIAPLRGDNAQLVHLVLFAAGAVLLPAGLIVIGLGWYGVSHTPYAYDQMSYLVSGGILGLGITFVGGFLYFGAWLAKVAADQKDAAKRLNDTLLILADAVAQNSAPAAVAAPVVAPTAAVAATVVAPVIEAPAARPAAPPPPAAAQRDPGSILVVAGSGTTLHRADCELLEGRDDLQPAGHEAYRLTACRLCRPRD